MRSERTVRALYAVTMGEFQGFFQLFHGIVKFMQNRVGNSEKKNYAKHNYC